ncbi:hypothetical protein [Xanthomonas albilineans]|uniref:hypothetical protein n=1 Tax=Xanthomonas albilineans TaxID=29447 RepID=UPI000B279626|nr:hypothetical protein [Xanthomonas albilineans]
MKHNIDIEEPIATNPEFRDQSLSMAYALCLRIMGEYSCRSLDGKQGSIKRNRNRWKADAAAECADAILALDNKSKASQEVQLNDVRSGQAMESTTGESSGG